MLLSGAEVSLNGTGTVQGGTAGNGNTGGAGAYIAGGASLAGDGTVLGGSVLANANGFGGNGGAGVYLAGTLDNAGRITGGTGGYGSGFAAAGGNYVGLSGTKWLFESSSLGNDTVISSAGLATIKTEGNGTYPGGQSSVPSNVVELDGAQALVNSFGTNDLIEDCAGLATINASNDANIEMDGGAATVYAHSEGSVRACFTGQGGGRLDFINNSTVAATVSGNVPGGSGGSVTAFGGVGGGVYVGGSGGNNSLIGGDGKVNLVAGNGNNNVLEAAGFSTSYAGQNILVAGSGTATLTADSTAGYNEFYGGTGSVVITSFGKGAQTYYVGAKGSETITGSRAAVATNEYILDQDSTGAGVDAITNFKLGTDHIDINLNGSLSGVTINAIATLTSSVNNPNGGSSIT